METMTPSEQIEWIRDDVTSLCETRQHMPKLVYLLSVADHNALVDSTRSVSGVKPHTADGRHWIWVGSWAVEVIADANKPAGLSPHRCYRCPCGELFLDDANRSGKCVGCQMERVAAEVHKISTPVGHIPVRAYPTLKPDELRIESGTWNLDADLREKLEQERRTDGPHCWGCYQPAAYSALDQTMRCDECRAKSGLPRRGVKHGPGGRGTEGPCDADCPKCLSEELAGSFDRILDAHYPRDENGRHYIPVPPKVDWSKFTKSPNPGPGFRYVTPVQEKTSTTFRATPVEAGIRLEFGPRPDGFAQSKIDEIKAMLTAPVKGKR